MRIVDLLPTSFVESDFVTNQRLKYEASLTRRIVVDTTAYVTGACVGTIVAVGAIKVVKKLSN